MYHTFIQKIIKTLQNIKHVIDDRRGGKLEAVLNY